MSRWIGKILCLLGWGLSAAVAAPPTAESAVRGATADFYRAINNRCSELPLEQAELYHLVDQILMPLADFPRMSRWVLGKYWHQASVEQRSEFSQQFKHLLIRTYAAAVSKASPENIVYLPAQPSSRHDRELVRTEVHIAGVAVLQVNYPMLYKSGRWLVYDVRIEGISLVSTYRSSFGDKIKRLGIQGVIDSLAQENRQQTADSKPLHMAAADSCR